MAQAAPVAISIPGDAIVQELQALDITHVINVPDTHQRTLLSALARQSQMRLLTACTEDEAIAIKRRLYIGGQRPILSIQQVGLLAAMNNVKGIAMDARIPTCMLIGYFVVMSPGPRAKMLPAPFTSSSDARYVGHTVLSNGRTRRSARHRQRVPPQPRAPGPSVILVGAPTS